MSNAVICLSVMHIPARCWIERTRWRLAEEADQVFMHVIRQLGVAHWRRLTILAAVRLWGSVEEALRG